MWLDWIGTTPVPGVQYKWTGDIEKYHALERDEEGLRTWLWFHPEEKSQLSANR